MARPSRCRKIHSFPDHWNFSCEDQTEDQEIIQMSLDEYECIRLIDYRGLTQEECAEKMGVARTTVTSIYMNARKKLAEFLVDGMKLQLSGGNYAISKQNKEEILHLDEKRSQIMRVAVTYEDGQVFQHFGKTEEFKIYDIEEGKIVDTKVLNTNGQGHGALASFLKEAKVDALICGGIGGGAKAALDEAGITLYSGLKGSVDQAIEALNKGELVSGQGATCGHHEHNHGHSCGSHGHGHEHGHSCGSHGHKNNCGH